MKKQRIELINKMLVVFITMSMTFVGAFTKIQAVSSYAQYEITIDYIDNTTNKKLTTSVKEIKNEGETWSYVSPDIEGYELVDSTQNTMNGTATGSAVNIIHTVKYQEKTDASYRIVGIWEDMDGVYHEISDVSFTGTMNTVITTTAPVISGYTLIATTDNTLTISGDGNAVKYYYYTKDIDVFTIFFYTQGTYVPHITAVIGDTITGPTITPTRTGYTFAGWDTAIPATMPANNLYINATWNPVAVNYSIEYYMEDRTSFGSYVLHSTRVANTGLTDSTTPTAPTLTVGTGAGQMPWYHEYASETPTVIKADGSSVLRVYYDLVEVDVTYKIRIDDTATYVDIVPLFKAKVYGTLPFISPSEAEALHLANSGTRPHYRGTFINSSYAVGTPILLPTIVNSSTKTSNIYIEFSDWQPTTSYTLFNRETVDGLFVVDPIWSETVMVVHGLNMYFTAPAGFEAKRQKQGLAQSDGSILWDDDGWINTWPEGPGIWRYSFLNGFWDRVELELTRIEYPITYMSNGVVEASVDYKYEKEFIVANDINSSTLTPPTPGYNFAGWYDNSSFTGEPVTKGTTPVGGTVLYAKWEPEKFTVTFNSNGGSAVSTQEVLPSATATRPATEPTRTGAIFIDWYYEDDILSGHYVRANFDKPIEKDVELIAMWDPGRITVGYTVEHRDIDGNLLLTESKQGIYPETAVGQALGMGVTERDNLKYVDTEYKTIQLSLNATQNVITFTYYDDLDTVDYVVYHLEEGTLNEISRDNINSTHWLLEVFEKNISGYEPIVQSQSAILSEGMPVYTFYYTKLNSPVVQPPNINTGVESASTLPYVGMALATVGGAVVVAMKRKKKEEGEE